MPERCIFCGKTVSYFDKKTLLCGNVLQTVCPVCWAGAQDQSQETRAHRALDSGRARDPEAIQAYLDRQEEDRHRREEARKTLQTDLRCLRCGGVMERYGRKHLHLGDEGLFGTVARDGLFASWLTMDVLRCAQCGRAEFFLPDPPPLDNIPSTRENKQVTCPVCGTRHSSLINCPDCALNRRSAPKSERPPRGKKPPWEK